MTHPRPAILARPRISVSMSMWLVLSAACVPGLSVAEDELPEDEAAPEEPAETTPEDSGDPPALNAPEEEWLELEVTPDFGSAVETGLESDAGDGSLSEELSLLFSEDGGRASKRPTTRMGVRPLLGLQGAAPTEGSGAVGASAGLRIVHQWWSPTNDPIRPAGENRLQVSGLFGGVSGFDATFDAVGGSWFGPVGLFGGGMVRADRRSWTPEVSLPPAVGVGPAGQVAVQLGRFSPWAGVSPAWLVAGDRPGMAESPWDELTYRGGVVVHKTLLQLRLSGSYRQVAGADLWDACLGLHLGIGPTKSERKKADSQSAARSTR